MEWAAEMAEQTDMMLAALREEDGSEAVREKMALTAEIRRMVLQGAKGFSDAAQGRPMNHGQGEMEAAAYANAYRRGARARQKLIEQPPELVRERPPVQGNSRGTQPRPGGRERTPGRGAERPPAGPGGRERTPGRGAERPPAGPGRSGAGRGTRESGRDRRSGGRG